MASLFVHVVIYNEDGLVIEQLVRSYDGSYGYEVERVFTELGGVVAPKIDIHHSR